MKCMNTEYFERSYVEYALELARKIGMNQSEFAKAIWPLKSDASANTTIIALKNKNSRGKPQNLRISDAIRMAEILGREFPSLCFEVWEKNKLACKDAECGNENETFRDHYHAAPQATAEAGVQNIESTRH